LFLSAQLTHVRLSDNKEVFMDRGLINRNKNEVNPWSALGQDIWEMFDRFNRDFDSSLTSSSQEFVPKIEVKEQGNTYHVCAEVPGMNEKDINVTLKDNRLIIEGEKKEETKNEDKKKGVFHSEFKYGRFYRAIPLSDEVDSERVSATYKDGVLAIEMEKKPRLDNTKKIQISSGKKSEQSQTKH
jgi:HSP20 family protein